MKHPPPRRTFRSLPRRLGWRLPLLALVLALLLGRGLGWLGSAGPRPAAAPAQRKTPSAEVLVTAAAAPERTTGSVRLAAGLPPVPAGEGLLPAATASSESPAAVPEPSSAANLAVASTATTEDAADRSVATAVTPEVVPGTEDDLLHSLLGLIASRRDEGQFGRALQVLADLRALPLLPAQQLSVAAAADELAAAIALLAAGVRRDTEAGRALLAATTLAAVDAGGLAAVSGELQPWLQEAGLTVALDAPMARPVAPAATPQPLPKQRAVRWLQDGSWVQGVVVETRGSAVGLWLRDGERQRFPRLSHCDLEPVAPDAAEALELALAAAAAGRAVLARLWLLAAAQLPTPEAADFAVRRAAVFDWLR